MKRIPASAVVILAAAAGFTAAALPAAAKAPNSRVGIGIGYLPPTRAQPYFIGHIHSGSMSCVTNRKVIIYRVINPGKRRVFKSGSTDSNGAYAVPLNSKMPTAAYFAAVKASGSCPAGKSGLLPVGQKQLNIVYGA